MSTTTKTHEPCRLERAWDVAMARGVHDVIERLTGHTCPGSGHCIGETHLFRPHAA